MATPSVLVRIPEAARLLGIGRTTIYALVRRRVLKLVKIGRCSRISRTQLERLIGRLAQ